MTMQVNGYKRWRIAQQVVMPPQPIDPWMWDRIRIVTATVAGVVQSGPCTGSNNSN